MLKPRWRHDALKTPERFRAALLEWFDREGRDYPWRRTRDPYAILVSEVMLQQTQVATVLKRGFYGRFLERFPDTARLAEAGDDELLKAWEGLGYYRRARMLREAARAVENAHGGVFPAEFEAVLALPGVGRYTAGAVASFAFGIAAPVVDGNVMRVLSRLTDDWDAIDLGPTQRRMWERAERLLDAERPGAFNSALMELGQTRCRPGVPDCLGCPVAEFCRTRAPETLPRKARKAAVTPLDECAICAVRDGKLLMRQLGRGRRVGMWRLPEREAGEVAGRRLMAERKYGITRYRVTLKVFAGTSDDARPGEVWQPLDHLTALAMPPVDRAMVEHLLKEEIA